MSRLGHTLKSNRDAGHPSLGIFLTNGYPPSLDTLSVMNAVARGGADFVELGMPFSDPLGEGKTIQRSNERALAAGVRFSDAFKVASAFRAGHETPLALMGYVNPVLRYGIGNFFRDARSSGVDAVILPDLPPEEAEPLRLEAAAAEIDLVFLIAPTTPDVRIRMIDNLSTGFVYAVSVAGLTGGAVDRATDPGAYLRRARALAVRNPLLVGFGISSHDDVVRMSAHCDGCIVGSAFIRELERLWNADAHDASDCLRTVEEFVSELKHGPTTRPDLPTAKTGVSPRAETDRRR